VELVNLLDLQLLSDGDSPEKSDEDDGSEWRMDGTEKSIETHPFISQLHIYIILSLSVVIRQWTQLGNLASGGVWDVMHPKLLQALVKVFCYWCDHLRP